MQSKQLVVNSRRVVENKKPYSTERQDRTRKNDVKKTDLS